MPLVPRKIRRLPAGGNGRGLAPRRTSAEMYNGSFVIQQGLRDKKIVTAQQQLIDARGTVETVPPLVGRQKEQLAAGQLAIALACADEAPDLLEDRLETLVGMSYEPKDMVEIVLTEREKSFLPAAQAICGLLLEKAAEANA